MRRHRRDRRLPVEPLDQLGDAAAARRAQALSGGSEAGFGPESCSGSPASASRNPTDVDDQDLEADDTLDQGERLELRRDRASGRVGWYLQGRVAPHGHTVLLCLADGSTVAGRLHGGDPDRRPRLALDLADGEAPSLPVALLELPASARLAWPEKAAHAAD